MADKLRTDYDTLTNLSNALSAARDDLTQKFQAVVNSITVMVPGGSWAGPASAAFNQWWSTNQTVPAKMFQQLQTMPEDVAQIVSMIEQTDANSAQTFTSFAA